MEIVRHYLASKRGSADEYKHLVSQARDSKPLRSGSSDVHTDDVWDDEPSELSRALQKSLDRNNEDTSVPAALARLQAKAVKNHSNE